MPSVDARPDIGATDAYGIPLIDAEVDATPTADASVDAGTDLDGGGVALYDAPPMPEDED